MKKGLGTKVLLGCWAVFFAVAFVLDIAHSPIEFPGVRAVVSDALGTFAIALIATGLVWIYYRTLGKRHVA